MKVNVLQAKDIKFGAWCWWSDWIDVCVFTGMYSDGYILQMKISRRNAKKFKCRKFQGIIGTVTASVSNAGDLTQMSRGE